MIVLIIIFLIYCYSSALAPEGKYHDFMKYEVLMKIKRKYRPATTRFIYLKSLDLPYPLIFKPTTCSGLSIGVKKIDNKQQAIDFIQKNKKKINDYIVQQYIPNETEIVVYYHRGIENIYQRFFDDDHRTVKIIKRNDLLTDKFRYEIDNAIHALDLQDSCRLDILLYNNKFYIIEINFACACPANMMNRNTNYRQIIRYIGKNIKMGFYNILKGYGATAKNTFNVINCELKK